MKLSSVLNIMILFFIVSGACKEKSDLRATENIPAVKISEKRVDTNLLKRVAAEGMTYYQGIPFTGEAMVVKDNKVVGSTQFSDGKKHGVDQKWYYDGTLSYRANYVNGKRHGECSSWWKGGIYKSKFHFVHGKSHGILRQWYSNGNIFKERNLANGREEGVQRAWRKNGKLYTNYEAVNGRIFGLKRAALCFELENEIIVNND